MSYRHTPHRTSIRTIRADRSMTPLTPIDELEKTYGRLTVVEYLGGNEQGEGAMWKCECECGRSIEARGSLLRQGKVRSCGRCRKRNPRRRVKWESPELMMAILTVGVPPCDVGFGCPWLKRCCAFVYSFSFSFVFACCAVRSLLQVRYRRRRVQARMTI